MLVAVLSLARAGSNIVCCESLHGGTFHQFKTLLPMIGIEARFFADDSSADEIRRLVDQQTRLVFVETIGNPRFSVPDFEMLAAVAHENGVPLVVRFAADPFRGRVDDDVGAVLDGAAEEARGGEGRIDLDTVQKERKEEKEKRKRKRKKRGHGTALGGVVVDSGKFDWGHSREHFPQLHGGRAGTADANFYRDYGRRAYSIFLKSEMQRDIEASLGADAAHHLLLGLETLSLRCERQAANTLQLARWPQARPA